MRIYALLPPYHTVTFHVLQTSRHRTLYRANFTLVNGNNTITENHGYKLKYFYFKYIYSFPVRQSHIWYRARPVHMGVYGKCYRL